MLGVEVPAGALYYGRTRRRRDVVFDQNLRILTKTTCARLHELIGRGQTPTAVREAKCDSCSLLNLCLPGAVDGKRSARRYFARALQRSLASEIGDGED